MLNGKQFSFDQENVEKVIRYSQQRGINPAGVVRQLSAISESPDRTLSLQKLQIPSFLWNTVLLTRQQYRVQL
jgi:hypothetical protein